MPQGFDSWTQVLTDWAVSRAFRQIRGPRCLESRPELAVPLVVEISAALRERLLTRRARQVALIQEKVIEPAYEQAGGADYQTLRETMEAAQENYLAIYCQCRDLGAPSLTAPRKAMELQQAEYGKFCERLAPAVNRSRNQAIAEFWKAQPATGVPDVVFVDAAPHLSVARLARIHPPWWGLFLGRLQKTLATGHPARGYLLDALPRLRAEAKKKTLDGVIAEWRSAHADQWGWYRPVHPQMLTQRSAKYAGQLTHWIDALAPGYRTSSSRRRELHAALAARLTQADPCHFPLPADSDSWAFGVHGRN